MAKNKKRKLEKFGKVNVFPSVLLFLFSVAAALFSVEMVTAAFMLFSMTNQIDVSSMETESIGQIVSERLENGDTYEEALDYVQSAKFNTEAAYIIKDDMSEGFGGLTYDPAIESRSNDTWGAVLYPDKNFSSDIVKFTKEPDSLTGSNISIDTLKLLKKYKNDAEHITEYNTVGDFRSDAAWRSEVIIHAPYWVRSEQLRDGSYVLTKQYLDFKRSDILYSLIIGAQVLLLMLIPATMLFRNVIRTHRLQRDITEYIKTDTVTGGNNRYYFEHKAPKVLEDIRSGGKMYAVVDFSMSKYNSYCICHGTEEGKRLLTKIDDFFDEKLNDKKGEICAHYEKSDFAILMSCVSAEECTSRINSWMRELPAYIGHPASVFHAGVCFINPLQSSGFIPVRRINTNAADLFANAAAARASITDSDSSELSVFGKLLLETQIWEHKVEENMQSALDNGEFKVYVQPKYSPVTNELAGGEALIRWISPTDGFIGPGKFIPIFEKNGFITKIDDFMISNVAALQAQWIAEGKKIVPISVNVSRAHFSRPDLAEHICRLVDEHNVPHRFVEIELTESAFFDDKETLLNTVKKLKQLGFEISMDDFGAGYSSLNSLKDLPLDVLKLDAEFFRGESEENRGEIVVSEAIQLAKSLNMRIVAEGVEKKEQVDFLANCGCDMIQGFYYAKPMPVNEFEERMKNN